MMSGRYLLASGGLDAPPDVGDSRLGSLSIGLAFGGRPDLVFGGLFLVALLVYLVRRGEARRAEIRRYAGLTARALLRDRLSSGAVQLWALRVASPKRRVVRARRGGDDEGADVSSHHPGAELYYYIVAPVRWTYAFPYVTLPPPPAYPWGVVSYYYGEMTGGLLTTTPIVLATIPAIPLLAWRGGPDSVG